MEDKCLPENIKLKSNFLGPKSENGDWLEKNIVAIFSSWCEWRRNRFPTDGPAISKYDTSLLEYKGFQLDIYDLQKQLFSRFEAEVPKYSPRYMGHMVSEISLPALFGHIIGLIHNPNNSSLISSKVGLNIENEAIAELSAMIGFGEQGMGHFTSGGTIANIEGAWRARYRLDNGLAFGALATELGVESFSLFEAAHMGQKKIDTFFTDERLTHTEAKKYSFVYSGPFQTQVKYQSVFKIGFSGPVLLVPGHKHFSWQKTISLMGFGEEALWSVDIDRGGRLCVKDLERKIEKARKDNRPILCVVSVAGTTELGMIDPVDKVQDLLDKYKEQNIHIWHHVDGAYGGIYASLLHGEKVLEVNLSSDVLDSLAALKRVDSITLDPHKLAMVPYACGALLTRDKKSYYISKFDAPYLSNNKGEDTGKWNSTLEGSRAATGACATWMVAKSLGFNRGGLGTVLSMGLKAKKILEKKLTQGHKQIRVFPSTDSNIVCFSLSEDHENLSNSNKRTQHVYDEICRGDDFSVSKTTLMLSTYGELISDWSSNEWSASIDCQTLVLIRMVIMNPFSASKENSFDYLSEFILYLSRCIDQVPDELSRPGKNLE